MKRLEYLDARSTQTLREGIRELRAAEDAETDAAQNVAPELVDDIDVHDAIHVLFGCPTNLAGEIIAHVWTAFGTTLPMRDMHRVNQHDNHRQALSEIGHWRLARTWFISLPRILLTILNARRMPRLWPAQTFEAFLDQRLCDIRATFGIRLSRVNPDDTSNSGAALRHIRTKTA